MPPTERRPLWGVYIYIYSTRHNILSQSHEDGLHLASQQIRSGFARHAVALQAVHKNRSASDSTSLTQ